jgi:hypothetical protein
MFCHTQTTSDGQVGFAAVAQSHNVPTPYLNTLIKC